VIRKRKIPEEKAISFRVFPEEKTVYASHGQTILDAILSADLEIDHTCGGMGTCGTCRVFVEQGLDSFQEPGEIESEIRNQRGFAHNERLCCQNLAAPGLILRKPES
jgi:ferredoxin